MNSEEEGAVVLVLIKRKRNIQKRKHQFWVHPLLQPRLQTGQFYTLYNDLIQDENKFFSYFRMSRQSFNELLNLITNDISGGDTNMRRCIPAIERLAVTLRYLGAGSSLTDLHMAFRCGITTLSRLIRRVCQAIWNLKDICMTLPTNDQWVEIADGFEKNANFPNSIGAIDGKHIRIIKPVDSGSLYYNYKHF